MDGSMPTEVHEGKYHESVEICKVENGYIVKHIPNEGPCKTYVALTHEEAHERVKKCLDISLEKDEEHEKEEHSEEAKKGRSDKYEASY